MHTVDIEDARTNLTRLIDQAAKGEPFIIARAGKPLVTVVPLSAPEPSEIRRVGFLAGQISTPANFDRMGQDEVAQLFGKS